jgi:hypothetical protein
MPAPDRTRRNAAAAPSTAVVRGVRRRSDYEYLGLPLWAVAIGPDPAQGELRGHARGILAVGDIATGVIALGGLARGGIAVGGLAVGVVAIGGLALGALGLGGLAIGLLAIGGAAIGWAAVGGAAAGVYAAGGAAWGTYVISAVERSPEAVAFFAQWDALRSVLPPNPIRR